MSEHRPAPTAAPAATTVALVLGVGLVALAVVGVRDLVVAEGWAQGRPWLPALAGRLDGTTASVGTAVIGGVAAVVGLVLLVVAVRPARRTHVPLGASELDAWVTPRGVAAVARDVADRSSGALGARVAKVSPRSVQVAVRSDRGPEVAQQAQQNVDAALAVLERPRVSVRHEARSTSRSAS